MNDWMKVKVSVQLTREFLSDILVTAFDGNCGGCWYWASPDWGFAITPGSSWLEGEPIHIKDGDTNYNTLWSKVHIIEPCEVSGQMNDRHFAVTQETVAKGIQQFLDDPLWNRSAHLYTGVTELDAGEIDADLADSIVQQGLFGEVVYG